MALRIEKSEVQAVQPYIYETSMIQ